MAVRLISRQKFCPNGFQFYIAPLKWQAPRMASFDQIVNGAISALKANPTVARQLGWDLSYNAMADRCDEFNAAICQSMGWSDYISEPAGVSLPKSQPRDQQTILQNLRSAVAASKELVAGAKTLIEFLDSGEPPVDKDVAESRAAVCAACPKNEPGDFTKWFTSPAAELIRRQIERAQSRSLTTSMDAKLNLCTACHCPLRLKVHIPLPWIVKRLSPEQMARLKEAPACWILAP